MILVQLIQQIGVGVRTYKWSGVNIDGLEGVKRWMQMMEERPACKKGVAVPIDIMELMRNMKQSKDLTDTGSKIIQKQENKDEFTKSISCSWRRRLTLYT